MKVKLIERVIKVLNLSPYTPNFNNWSDKEKIKLGKLLIKNKQIQVDNKIITNPYEMVSIKSKIRRVNIKLNYDRSYLNIFNYLIKRKSLNARKTTTYQHQLLLKKDPLNIKDTLDFIVFQAGFSNSIKESRHFIKQGYISINDKIINKYKYIPNKGDIITNNHPNALFNYFHQKYLALLPWQNKKYNRKYYRLPIANNYHNLIKTNFNQVIWNKK